MKIIENDDDENDKLVKNNKFMQNNKIHKWIENNRKSKIIK